MFIALVTVDLLPTDDIYEDVIKITETEAMNPRMALLRLES